MPPVDNYRAYWYARAPELNPVEGAETIVSGTVEGVSAVGETPELRPDGRGQGWSTRVDFRVAHGLKGAGAQDGDILPLRYLTPEHGYLGGLGPRPHMLGLGASYLLFPGPSGAEGAMAFDPNGDPPPVPLATAATDMRGDGTPAEMMADLLISSLRASDRKLEEYMIPPLAYLAHFHDQAGARQALLQRAQSRDAEGAVPALRGLTRWDPLAEDVAELVERLSRGDSPTMAGVALAVRLREGGTAMLPEVIEWLRDPEVTDDDAAYIAGALSTMPDERVTERLLQEYGQLLDPQMPLSLRRAVVRRLADIGTMEVAPLLLRALDDPDTDMSTGNAVVWIAMVGLWRASEGFRHGLDRYCPGPDPFVADSRHYVRLWKAWWETAQNGWPPEDEHTDTPSTGPILPPAYEGTPPQ